MKKPKKFENLSLKSEFFTDLILVETTIHTENIIFGCEYCPKKFLVLSSGYPRPYDLIVTAGKHYFDKHWTALKPYIIEEPPVSAPAIYATGGLVMPSVTVSRGGIAYGPTISSTVM